MPAPTATIPAALAAVALMLAGCGSSSSSPGSSSVQAAGSSSSASSQYCVLAKSLSDASNSISSLAPNADITQVRSLVGGFTAGVDAAAAAAPSSMASDWNALKTAYDGAVADLASAKSTSDAFTILSTKFDTPALNNAGKNIDAATKSLCGFTISNSSSTTGTPSAPSPGTTDTGSSTMSTGSATSS